MDIYVDFPKINYANTAYDIAYFSDCALGKIKSIFMEEYNEDRENLCGFFLPPFQRPEIWDLERKQKLVESIFCEINIGSIVYVSNFSAPEVDGWLIDGQQRLTAIRDFTKGEFAVFNDQLSYENMNEAILKFYGGRERKASSIWKGNTIDCRKIENVSDPELLKDLYVRLNFGGMEHERDELRSLAGM